MDKLFAIAGGILFVVVLGLLGQADYEAELEEQDFACNMHLTYLIDAIHDVPPEDRRGWPITKEEFRKVCGGDE